MKNESAFPFVPVLGRGAFGRAVLEGQSRTFPLEQGGVYPLTCGFSAACGRADVVVSYHAIHTQTNQGGRFRLTGVPAGSQELSAWHPLFEEKTQVVDVVEGGNKPDNPGDRAARRRGDRDGVLCVRRRCARSSTGGSRERSRLTSGAR